MRSAMTKCKGCGSWHYWGDEHRCQRGPFDCRECGLKHDRFASHHTGVAPCLHALASELDALKTRMEATERPNRVLADVLAGLWGVRD